MHMYVEWAHKYAPLDATRAMLKKVPTYDIILKNTRGQFRIASSASKKAARQPDAAIQKRPRDICIQLSLQTCGAIACLRRSDEN